MVSGAVVSEAVDEEVKLMNVIVPKIVPKVESKDNNRTINNKR
ncbi:hypothetical protein PPEP_b0926 [Pseudoalteromonas peptidolytica F12-50-A1]|uniref:Uncharacterized protein n=1 Tax=Pseudoalteromonas peptidolytica F12-50-A1 TaxID=1315280 RepID=A0A8I0N1H6_9GAMM|nr:hypothetical protein [Pseudoalteromonas peptidolytica F12-50-A1]GEK11185.1 hypothetical protein PPE03_34340 [Pseudoalteromonas peptidolytica]